MICKFGSCALESLVWVCTRVYWYDLNEFVECNRDRRFWIFIWFKHWIWKLGTCAKKFWTYFCFCFTSPNYRSHMFIHNLVGSGYSGEIFCNPILELVIWLFLKYNLWPTKPCIRSCLWTFRSGGYGWVGRIVWVTG